MAILSLMMGRCAAAALAESRPYSAGMKRETPAARAASMRGFCEATAKAVTQEAWGAFSVGRAVVGGVCVRKLFLG